MCFCVLRIASCSTIHFKRNFTCLITWSGKQSTLHICPHHQHTGGKARAVRLLDKIHESRPLYIITHGTVIHYGTSPRIPSPRIARVCFSVPDPIMFRFLMKIATPFPPKRNALMRSFNEIFIYCSFRENCVLLTLILGVPPRSCSRFSGAFPRKRSSPKNARQQQ